MQALRRLLKDRSSAVRTAAAEALAGFGPDPAAAADLIAATGDLDRAVRFAASVALLKLNGPTDSPAARTLVALVADPDAVPDRLAIFEVLKRTERRRAGSGGWTHSWRYLLTATRLYSPM